MILLCYDGSEDAQAAAERAARVFPGAPVTVLTLWEPYVEMVAQSGFGVAYPPPLADVEQIDAAVEEQAQTIAQEGAELLTRAGVAAQPRAETSGRALPRGGGCRAAAGVPHAAHGRAGEPGSRLRRLVWRTGAGRRVPGRVRSGRGSPVLRWARAAGSWASTDRSRVRADPHVLGPVPAGCTPGG